MISTRKDQSLLHKDLKTLGVSADRIEDDLQSLNNNISTQLRLATDRRVEDFKTLHAELLHLRATVQQDKQRAYILKALGFDKDEERIDHVKKEHSKTFEWIFEDGDNSYANVSFNEWLQSGHGIFHFLGKAGSGKSTLMKYVYQNAQTKRQLTTWAGNRQLVLCQFFFWKPGTPMQKSLKGLTRALLRGIMEQAPQLMEMAFPTLWERAQTTPFNLAYDIGLSHLDVQGAPEKIIKSSEVYKSLRFCFFVDGLDEFDEFSDLDAEHFCYSDLINLLIDWTRDRPEVKICVSSRDWSLFNQAFNTVQQLRLQDLTRNDMKALVEDNLKELSSDPAYSKLVNQVVDTAEGVFLWVVLVLRSLRQGLQYDDSVHRLQEHLERMPTGLENFIRFMLESIDRVYLSRSIQIFALAVSGHDWSLLRYSFLEDLKDNPKYALSEAHLLDNACLQKRLEHMRSQLDACCKGLLEVRNTSEIRLLPQLRDRVTFIHRSVQDIFEDETSEGETERVRNIKRGVYEKRRDNSIHLDVAHTFLAEVKSIDLQFSHGNQKPLDRELRAVSKSIQETWAWTQTFDFEFTKTLDDVLQGSPFGGLKFVPGADLPFFLNDQSPQEQCDFVVGGKADLFATLASDGFGEFILEGTNQDTGLICGRPVGYLVFCALKGFGMSPSSHLPRYPKMIERFLSIKSDLNSPVSLHQRPGLSCWVMLLIQQISALEALFDQGLLGLAPETSEIFLLFLMNGADPYVWIVRDHSTPTYCYYSYYPHFKAGLETLLGGGDQGEPRDILSLREWLEKAGDDQLAHAILHILPTQLEYKHEWENCLNGTTLSSMIGLGQKKRRDTVIFRRPCLSRGELTDRGDLLRPYYRLWM